ncbi:uncharacterized protein LOC113359987 [Papaver somniferum]|uniref:uncharacterized protein LOC113359987 n=1 Tax=Papaver somniferum TaxID=3469 RepID=UPI000E704C71|nr:uncharacterized protein LOC113359987 [Papaver somniferum]
MEEHLQHLSIMFEILRQHQLSVKESKCTFAQPTVGYLGHVVSSEGVAVENDKVKSVLDWQIPTTVKSLRGFLGLAGYYRKFVKDFGKISAPLTKLLKKDLFVWNDAATVSFRALQQALTTTPVLILPDFSKDFYLECDASGNGLGAVLMQSGRPIAYYSKGLTGFQSYTISTPIFSGVTEIIQESNDDPSLGKLIELLRHNPTCKPHYSYNDGILRYKGRIVVSPTSTWCTKLLHEFHSTPLGGHSGYFRTYKRTQQNFYWKGLKHSVKDFISHCDICQKNKSESVAPPGLLQPLPIPDDVWMDISMDFIDGFPTYYRKASILVVVDRLSKYAHFIALMHPYSAATIAEIFVGEIVRLHGMPRTIISDRDPTFMSNFWEAYFALQNTQLCRSSAYHPQTDGQTENGGIIPAITQLLICHLMKPYTLELHQRAVHAVDLNLRARDQILKLLKFHLQASQARMKYFFDKHRTERSFAVNDWRVGEVAYKLQLPLERRIHPVFHVSQLKLKLGSAVTTEAVLPVVVDYEKWEPETILERKMFKKGNQAGTKWIIHWKDHSKEDATWEDAHEILLRFPGIEA